MTTSGIAAVTFVAEYDRGRRESRTGNGRSNADAFDAAIRAWEKDIGDEQPWSDHKVEWLKHIGDPGAPLPRMKRPN